MLDEYPVEGYIQIPGRSKRVSKVRSILKEK